MTEERDADFSFFSDSINIEENYVAKSVVDPDEQVFTNPSFDATKSSGRIISGMASSPNLDTDGESVWQKGLDVSYLMKQGALNWMHVNKPDHIVGVPIEAVINKAGFFCKGMLFKNHPMADHVWSLAKSLADLNYPRKLGYSIEGKVLQRSAINKSKIIKAKITNLAITHIPVNTDATFEIVAKSFVPDRYDEVLGYIMKDSQLVKAADALGALSGQGATAGSGIVQDGQQGSTVLRRQSLEGGKVANLTDSDILDNPKKIEALLRSHFDGMFETRKSIYSLIKSVNPDAQDVLIDHLLDVIYLSGSIDNFINIVNNK